MERKRSKISFELLPYLVPCRGIDDPKYNFITSRAIRRKRRRPVATHTHELAQRRAKSKSDANMSYMYLPSWNTDPSQPDTWGADINSSLPDNGSETDNTSLQDTTTDENVDISDIRPPYGCANPYERIVMDNLRTYSLLLQEHNAISFCNYSSSAFVLQDFNEETMKLKRNSYVFVERRGIQFTDACELVYWCSCDPQHSSFIATLNVRVSQSFIEFQTRECIHVKVCKLLLHGHELEIAPEDFLHDPRFPVTTAPSRVSFDCVFPLHDGTTVCVYNWMRDYGVVTLANGGIVCVTCKYKECQHTAAILSWKESDYPPCLDLIFAHLDSSPTQSKQYLRLVGVSKDKVCLEPDKDQQNILQKGGIQNCIQLTDKGEVPLRCQLNNSECPNCSYELCLHYQQFHLVTETTTVLAQVETAKCFHCQTEVLYDGGKDAVLNMGVCLVSHDLLRTYLHLFWNGRFPMHSYHKVLVAKHHDSGDKAFNSIFPYYMFRASWYKYLSLLDIDFSAGFSCPKCSSQPDIVICDGTSLAFRRQMLRLKDPIEDAGEVLDGSSFKDRVFIQDAMCRNLLMRYSRTAHDNEIMLSFSDGDSEDLINRLHNFSPTLIPLITSWGTIVPCPSEYASLLKALGSQSPVCALIHPSSEVLDLVDKLIDGCEVRCDPNLWLKLQTNIPVLYQLLTDLDVTSVPSLLRPVLQKMKGATLRCFESTTPEVEQKPQLDELVAISYYPNLPRCRTRRIYKSDSSPKEKSCTKVYRGHPSLLPGIFTLFCSHGVCIGFEVMESMESPNVPFTTLKTRFKKAPAVVIYDNACSLHTYCLKRDPHFFKLTKFFIDRFHWKNHTGCNVAYDLDTYPHLASLNSEINEQANANLSKLKSQISYMNQDNFMMHCKLYIWYRNRLKIKKLT